MTEKNVDKSSFNEVAMGRLSAVEIYPDHHVVSMRLGATMPQPYLRRAV